MEDHKASVSATERTRPFDLCGFIMDYEVGSMDMERMTEGFQYLIDTGQAWTLQGHYGRVATALITAGLCHQRTIGKLHEETKENE